MKIENFRRINKSRSVHVRIVSSITNSSSVKACKSNAKYYMLEYSFVSMKTMTFYKTSHPGSNSFSQVDYIFTTTKLLSIAVFIIYITFMEQFINKYGKRQFCFGRFSSRCFKMYFSKLLHCKSDHCRPYQISKCISKL